MPARKSSVPVASKKMSIIARKRQRTCKKATNATTSSVSALVSVTALSTASTKRRA